MRLSSRMLAVLASSAALVAPLTIVTPADAAARPAKVPKGAVSVRVKKIVDGDTIDVVNSRGKTLRVRLLEIDTPERGQCWFHAATARTAALLPVGKLAYVLKDRDPKDRYGRHLFYVWNSGGSFVNRALVRYGYAKAVLYKPNDRYIKVMRADQAKARAARLRIWSGKCETAAGSQSPTKRPAPTPTSTKRATPSPTPTPAPPPSSGTDPRFSTCAEANRNGYGPYYRGKDPEYSWYQDRDGDGIVCER